MTQYNSLNVKLSDSQLKACVRYFLKTRYTSDLIT